MSNLVLYRAFGEAVYLDTPAGRITVTVLERRSRGVRLGIDAPADVRITRPEHHSTEGKPS